MTQPTPIESGAKAGTEAMAKGGVATDKIINTNTATLLASGNATTAAIQELTKAYQDLGTRNAKNLTVAIQKLTAVKNPIEFAELQQTLIQEGVQAAVSDSQKIAHLTAAVFTAAFDPVKQQIEAMQKTALN